MYLAWRRSVLGLGRVIAIANAALGIGMVAFAASHHLWISLPVLVVTGCSMVVQMAACNTVLQTLVDDDKRGRVMSIFSMCFMGITPFGSMLAGYLATLARPAAHHRHRRRGVRRRRRHLRAQARHAAATGHADLRPQGDPPGGRRGRSIHRGAGSRLDRINHRWTRERGCT